MNTYDITMTADYNGSGRDDSDWLYDAWNVTLYRGRRHLEIPFKMGTGHEGREPTLADVLDSLQSDARIDEWDEYDDVLGNLPYSKARVQADAIKTQANRLRAFLGDDYAAFLDEEYDQ